RDSETPTGKLEALSGKNVTIGPEKMKRHSYIQEMQGFLRRRTVGLRQENKALQGSDADTRSYGSGRRNWLWGFTTPGPARVFLACSPRSPRPRGVNARYLSGPRLPPNDGSCCR